MKGRALALQSSTSFFSYLPPVTPVKHKREEKKKKKKNKERGETQHCVPFHCHFILSSFLLSFFVILLYSSSFFIPSSFFLLLHYPAAGHAGDACRHKVEVHALTKRGRRRALGQQRLTSLHAQDTSRRSVAACASPIRRRAAAPPVDITPSAGGVSRQCQQQHQQQHKPGLTRLSRCSAAAHGAAMAKHPAAWVAVSRRQRPPAPHPLPAAAAPTKTRTAQNCCCPGPNSGRPCPDVDIWT